MALPTLVLFENHYDPTSSQVLGEALDDLNSIGYNCFRFEKDAATTFPEEKKLVANYIEQTNLLIKTVKDFFKIYTDFPSLSLNQLDKVLSPIPCEKVRTEAIQRFGSLCADQCRLNLYEKMSKMSFDAKGIDIAREEYSEAIDSAIKSVSMRNKILSKMNRRDVNMSSHLISDQDSNKGAIAVVGARHAKGIVTHLIESRGEKSLIYFFPYSPKRVSRESLKRLHGQTEGFLKDHIYVVDDEQSKKSFCAKVLKQVTRMLPYKEELDEETMHSRKLSELFQTKVRMFMHPGSFCDALVPYSDGIEKKLPDVVETFTREHEGNKYLVIPHIYTTDVAVPIHSMRA